MPAPASSLVAIVLSVGVACWVLLRPPNEPAPTEPGARLEVDRLMARQDELDRRLQQVEAGLASVPSVREQATRLPAPAPVAAEGTNVLERLAAVERLLQQVRSEQLAIGPMPTDVAGVVKALADKNLHGHDVGPELRQRRMDLRRRLLELAPGDPQAGKVLLDLADDYLLAHGARRAIELLDQFAGRTNVEASRLSKSYANLYGQAGDGDRARAIYDSLARDAGASEADRASARFWHAYSFYEQQRYDDAARGFQALIDSYGDEPPAAVRDSVAGARNYLKICRERR